MRARSQAIASDPVAEEAARDLLLSGGSAVGAVLAGYFAVAGAYAGVLLAPISVIVAGVGSGARAFDGRLRQPGRGTKRPRGFKQGDPIPDSARVAVPGSVAAALVAHAYDGGKSLGGIMKTGISRAERSGAASRASLLRRIRAVGAAALTEASFVRPLLHVAGPSQGGLVTPSDFGTASELDQPAHERKYGGGTLAEPPWAADFEESTSDELGIGGAVVAIDVRGVCAALCYRRVVDGLPVDELEIEVPLVAVPVRRGVTRIAPGASLPAPTPIAVARERNGAPIEVIATPGAARLDGSALEAATLRLRRNPSTQEVQALRA